MTTIPKGLTANQAAVLAFLQRMEDAYTVREIAEATSVHIGTVRTALNSLARYGFVETKGSAFSMGTTWGLVR